jgi:hypothetical protein
MDISEDGQVKSISCEKQRLISPISGSMIKGLGTINNYIGISNCLKDLNVYFWNLKDKIKPSHIFKGLNKDLVKGIPCNF